MLADVQALRGAPGTAGRQALQNGLNSEKFLLGNGGSVSPSNPACSLLHGTINWLVVLRDVEPRLLMVPTSPVELEIPHVVTSG